MPAAAEPSNCLLVIFGASGDLTKRKLIPSVYHLFAQKQLPQKFAVLGVSRSEMSDDQYRDGLKDFCKNYTDETWNEFARCIHYHAADSTRQADYAGLKQGIEELAQQYGTGQNRLYYLSMAPHLYEPTINQLGANGMVTEGKSWCSLERETPPWQRVIIEKPFGYDPASAAHLNRVVGRVFEEESIYRIDHVIGK